MGKWISSSDDEKLGMSKWKAGKLNGVPVKVKMSFPVIFKLPNDDNALKTDSLIESIEE